MGPRRLPALLFILALVAAACGSPVASTSPSASSAAAVCGSAPDPASGTGWDPPATAPTLVPIIVSNAITCGKTRFIFLFVDKANVVHSAPDQTAKVAFYDLGRDPKVAAATVDGAFVWTIQDQRGMYIANVDLPEAGTWGAEFTTQAPGAPAETTRLTFSVLDVNTSVAVGQKAPASKTPTAADTGGDLKKISTDPTPDPAFYQTSVADAIGARKPFILIFATPKFCTSQQCGPTLAHFKPVAAAHPEITFINVEPYKLEVKDGSLQPVLDAQGHLIATDISNAWGLLAEPWMFAVDRNGIVRGSYLLTISDAELNAILPVISAGS
ncbi:MAG: hypothetical protein QOE66_1361 [Chloroflexota bacterium]|nr:hypothetical protein [Chloroflexota bacterium]